LMDLPGIDLPPLREDGSHTYLSFTVQVSDRSDFVKHVVHRGFDVRTQSLTNTADLPCFARYARACPQARRTAARAVLLPIYPGYGSSELERGIEITREYFGARS